jgi:hypothetical protein
MTALWGTTSSLQTIRWQLLQARLKEILPFLRQHALNRIRLDNGTSSIPLEKSHAVAPSKLPALLILLMLFLQIVLAVFQILHKILKIWLFKIIF